MYEDEEKDIRALVQEWAKELSLHQLLIVSLSFGLNSLGMCLTDSEICRLFNWPSYNHGRVKKYRNIALQRLNFPKYAQLREALNDSFISS